MQMKHTKNLNPAGSELGTTLSYPNRSIADRDSWLWTSFQPRSQGVVEIWNTYI